MKKNEINQFEIDFKFIIRDFVCHLESLMCHG